MATAIPSRRIIFSVSNHFPRILPQRDNLSITCAKRSTSSPFVVGRITRRAMVINRTHTRAYSNPATGVVVEPPDFLDEAEKGIFTTLNEELRPTELEVCRVLEMVICDLQTMLICVWIPCLNNVLPVDYKIDSVLGPGCEWWLWKHVCCSGHIRAIQRAIYD